MNDQEIAEYIKTPEGRERLSVVMKHAVEVVDLIREVVPKAYELRQKLLDAGYDMEALRKDPVALKEALYAIGWLPRPS